MLMCQRTQHGPNLISRAFFFFFFLSGFFLLLFYLCRVCQPSAVKSKGNCINIYAHYTLSSAQLCPQKPHNLCVCLTRLYGWWEWPIELHTSVIASIYTGESFSNSCTHHIYINIPPKEEELFRKIASTQ
jgi:hypothetical protein